MPTLVKSLQRQLSYVRIDDDILKSQSLTNLMNSSPVDEVFEEQSAPSSNVELSNGHAKTDSTNGVDTPTRKST